MKIWAGPTPKLALKPVAMRDGLSHNINSIEKQSPIYLSNTILLSEKGTVHVVLFQSNNGNY